MKRVIAAIAFLALAGCGQAGRDQSASTGVASVGDVRGLVSEEKLMADKPAAEPEAIAGAPAPPPPPGQPPAPGTPPGGVMLAYAYTFGLEAPAQSVKPLMKKHEDECAKAGANLCQVLGSSTNANGENDISAELQIRAEPRWLAAFRAKLDGDAKGAGGELKSDAVTTEDLTRQIVDTEARLRAAHTLRDRLQNLLASRPGKLSDLLDVERELARVQGDIDSTESNLAVMRARVSMSVATLNYTSAGAPLTDRTFEPIKEALTNFMRIVAEVVAFMIQAIAVILPWVLLLWLVIWLMRGWLKRRRAAKAAKASLTAPT
ncbi:MAG: DUF4349 domain-containing protein [Pseudomonadota bacterium]